MALREEISGIVASMVGDGSQTPPAFLFGTENELNVMVDDVQLSDVVITPGPTEISPPVITTTLNPVVFMYALQGVNNEFTNNNSINNTYSVFMFFGFKIEFDENTQQCEPLDVKIIDLINEFLIRLSKARDADNKKIFEVNVGDSSKSRALFNKDDVNLYGRIITMDLKTFYNKKLCF